MRKFGERENKLRLTNLIFTRKQEGKSCEKDKSEKSEKQAKSDKSHKQEKKERNVGKKHHLMDVMKSCLKMVDDMEVID